MTLLAPAVLPFVDAAPRPAPVALPATRITRITESIEPTWREACWIGVLDGDVAEDIGRIRLDGGDRFGRARLLVRSSQGVVRGFVEVDVANGHVDVRRLRRLVGELEPPSERIVLERWPAVTVVVCERSGGDRLKRALNAVFDVDYPSFEVLVIGPSAHVESGPRLVEQFGAGRTLWMGGMEDGMGSARNRGLLIADGDVVAYTDDRVVVDRHWLRSLVGGLSRASDVACVTGLTTTGELSSKANVIADALYGPESIEADILRGDSDDRTAPIALHADLDGTHRNLAVQRDVVVNAGGWDAALARRFPVSGGEDTDLFVRLLHHGLAVGYEPSAVAWSFD